MRFELGGRIELTARDARGRLLPAKAEVRSADATELDVDFVARLDGGGTWTSDWQLSSLAPSEVFPNLAEGDYTVRLEHEGHAPQVVDVRVVPGSTVRRDVVLEAD